MPAKLSLSILWHSFRVICAFLDEYQQQVRNGNSRAWWSCHLTLVITASRRTNPHGDVITHSRTAKFTIDGQPLGIDELGLLPLLCWITQETEYWSTYYRREPPWHCQPQKILPHLSSQGCTNSKNGLMCVLKLGLLRQSQCDQRGDQSEDERAPETAGQTGDLVKQAREQATDQVSSLISAPWSLRSIPRHRHRRPA